MLWRRCCRAWLIVVVFLVGRALFGQTPQLLDRLPATRSPAPLVDPWSRPDYLDWLQRQSMLQEATAVAGELGGSTLPWTHRYGEPQPRQAVKAASVWLLDYPGSVITRPGQSVIATWGTPELWKALQEIGIELLHTGPVNLAGGVEGRRYTPTIDGWFDPISLSVDPQLGTDDEYRRLSQVAAAHRGLVAGDIVPLHTGKGPDFRLAERGWKSYPGMYVMVEIPEKHWPLLPPVNDLWRSEPIRKDAAQRLTQLGLLPGLIHSNDASAGALELTGWDATAEIPGADGRRRRWAYLHFFKPGQPTLNWIDPSANAQRMIAGQIVQNLYQRGVKILRLDAVPFLGIEPGKQPATTWHYQHPLSIWGTNYLAFLTRRLGGWTFQELNVPLEQLKPFIQNGSDLSYDFFTRTQVLHALLTADASALRLAYQFLKDANVGLVSLVHDLQNHDEITYQLAELDFRANERFQIDGQVLTGRQLREEMLKTMRRQAAGDAAPHNLLYRPQRDGVATTYAGFIAASLKIRDPYRATPEQVALIQRGHLLLAAANAMQPGVFSLSSWDLVGALPLPADSVKSLLADQDYRWVNRGGVDLLGENPTAARSAWGLPRAKSLYGSLPQQLQRPDSFASQLKRLLAARKRYSLPLGRLVAIPEVRARGVCVAMYLLDSGDYAITGLNFGRDAAREEIDLSAALRPKGASGRKILDVLADRELGTLTETGRLTLLLEPLSARTLVLRDGSPDALQSRIAPAR